MKLKEVAFNFIEIEAETDAERMILLHFHNKPVGSTTISPSNKTLIIHFDESDNL